MHAPGYLREALCALLVGEESVADDFFDDKTRTRLEAMSADEQLHWLSGQLWLCTDTLPGDYCRELEIPQGSSYAQAARLIRQR